MTRASPSGAVRLGLPVAIVLGLASGAGARASAGVNHGVSSAPVLAGPVVAEPRLRVVVTIPPLAGLVGPLLPANAEVSTLLTPGKSEHGYEFTPAELATLGRADLVVYVGLGLEPQVDRFLARNTRGTRQVVELGTLLGIAPSTPAAHDEHGHPIQSGDNPGHASPAESPRAAHEGDAHDEHDHAHLIDPHVWLDPVLVAQAIPGIQAGVAQALTNIGAGAKGVQELGASASGLVERVRSVDREYQDALTPFKGRAIVTHHAAFGRLASRYGLRVVEVIRPIETAEPTPGQIAEVVAKIRSEGVKVIFVEPQFNPGAARRIAEAAGVRLGTLDPLGDGDWFKLMRRNLDELVAKLSED